MCVRLINVIHFYLLLLLLLFVYLFIDILIVIRKYLTIHLRICAEDLPLQVVLVQLGLIVNLLIAPPPL